MTRTLVGEFFSREEAIDWARQVYGFENRPDLSWTVIPYYQGSWTLEVVSWSLD